VQRVLARMVDLRCTHLPDEFQLDMLGREVIEQATATAEQHGDHVQFQLVDLAGAEQGLRRDGSVHHGDPVTDRSPGQPGTLGDIGNETDGARRRLVGDLPVQDENRHTVVVVTAQWPASSYVRRPEISAWVARVSANTSPLGPGSFRLSSLLNRRNPPVPIGASGPSSGPVT
jgi:hypothetical protein